MTENYERNLKKESIAELFGVGVPSISKPLNHIYASGELKNNEEKRND